MARHLCAFALTLVVAASGWSAHAQDAAKGGGAAAPGPVFSGSGPDAAEYGAAAGFPLATRATAGRVDTLVGTYSHFDEYLPARPVKRAATPWLFKRAPEPPIFYNFRSGRYSIEDYLARNPTTGLLIAKDDTILYEHYQYARTDRDRLLSQSMAKTITAMLIGIAIAENKIRSVDDLVSAYVPGLADTEYGGTPLRALLHMSSGVAFTENYDGADDIARLGRDLFDPAGKLLPKFLNLKPGTRIVSHDGGIGDWPADETLEMRTPEKPVGVGGNSKIELWIVPADVHGDWSAELPRHGGTWRFNIGQHYQMLEVGARAEGRDLLVRNTRLRGEEVKLVITGLVGNRPWHHYFVGQAHGDAIDGEVTVSSGREQMSVYPWHAKRAR